MQNYIAPHQVNWHWEQLLDCSLRFYALMANQSSTVPLDLLLCDWMKSAGLHDGRNGDPLPLGLADLGGSQHFSSTTPVFMLCTNSIITSFAGDMFSPSLLFQEISRCFSSAIVTRQALSHFASLLGSSKFSISPSMLAFFGDMFPSNLQLWNRIRMRWDITPPQFCRRRNFYLFWLC